MRYNNNIVSCNNTLVHRNVVITLLYYDFDIWDGLGGHRGSWYRAQWRLYMDDYNTILI